MADFHEEGVQKVEEFPFVIAVKPHARAAFSSSGEINPSAMYQPALIIAP